MTVKNPALGLLPERIRARITVNARGCWIFGPRLNRNGYGRIRWNGAEPVVHRLVWELLVGPIAPGLVLDHVKARCSSRACCNPAHLEPVTPRENVHRGDAILMPPKIRVCERSAA